MTRLHPHAKQRLTERGISDEEAITTVKDGETFPAKFGRTGFRRNFSFNGTWRGKYYQTKQIEAYAVKENDDWLVITLIARYF